MIVLDRLTYSYPHTARSVLSDLNLEIEEGSFVAIVGENGAGKSTLCAALAGFIPHHFGGDLYGRVIVDGLDTSTTSLGELVKRVGLVFQNPLNQLSGTKLSVAEEVAFGLENLGVPRAEMGARIRSTLDMVGLTHLADRAPYALSGGEMQRLALACIIAMEPRVLVLDEPTAQLDPSGTRDLFGALKTLVAARRLTVVMVEHNTEWIAAFADRVIALHEGAVALDGDARSVLTSPRMQEIGVRIPSCTRAAREAQQKGWWPRDMDLPTTARQARIGFQASMVQGSGG